MITITCFGVTVDLRTAYPYFQKVHRQKPATRRYHIMPGSRTADVIFCLETVSGEILSKKRFVIRTCRFGEKIGPSSQKNVN